MKQPLLIFFFLPLLMTGQNAQTLVRNKEFYIRGNTSVVGNHILSTTEKKNFNDTEKVNDEFKMRYVDVDDSPATWSSSSAFLEIKPTSTIVYAALYWSGTYTGDTSIKEVVDDRVSFKTTQVRSKDISRVKFKTPGNSYLDIQGSIIYDGYNAKTVSIKKRSPYVCMAEVTNHVKDQISGFFTVANVAATEGEVIGGSSAGWLLYVVYEDIAGPLQYISTHHGLAFINNRSATIDFSNFKTVARGDVESALTIGALEGDVNLGRDAVAIYNSKSRAYVTLGNKVRSLSNFLNSSLTIGDSIITKREPSSLNMLGFDIAHIPIPNASNTLISNNATNVNIKFETRSDRFFVFFTAFQTTISERNYKENTENYSAFAKTAPPQDYSAQKNLAVGVKTEPTSDQKKEELTAEVPQPAITETSEELLSPNLKRLLNKTALNIPNVEPGYYIINSVFSELENAEKWCSQLEEEGLQSQLFFRPEKNLYYIYLDSHPNALLMKKKLNEFKKNELLKQSWLLKINPK